MKIELASNDIDEDLIKEELISAGVDVVDIVPPRTMTYLVDGVEQAPKIIKGYIELKSKDDEIKAKGILLSHNPRARAEEQEAKKIADIVKTIKESPNLRAELVSELIKDARLEKPTKGNTR